MCDLHPGRRGCLRRRFALRANACWTDDEQWDPRAAQGRGSDTTKDDLGQAGVTMRGHGNQSAAGKIFDHLHTLACLSKLNQRMRNICENRS